MIRKFLLPLAGVALVATSASTATAANWPPVPGDLILGVQATGGQGATTNVFFNLGSAATLRDTPTPGLVANLDAELQAAFGATWATRTDLYFGVIGVRTNTPPSGLGSQAPVNGDPGRTIYASKGTTVAGSATPWTGFNVSALGSAATSHLGQVDAIDGLAANGNQVLTLVQATNPVQWNNGWTAFNPVPGTAYSIFSGGIQAQMSASGAIVDVFRIVGFSGVGSYITSVTLGTNGDVNVARAGGAATFFTVATGTATNGTITGADGVTLYASGTNALIRAVPNSGFGFVNFTTDLTGSTNPQNLLVDANKTVGAVFAPFPSVTSPTATDITDVSANLGGNVTGDGGQSLTGRGVVVSEFDLNANPRIGGSNVTDLTTAAATGVFTLAATGLMEGTTYAYAAYGTSASGTGYSSVAIFTTDTNVSFTGGVGSVMDRDIQAGDTQRFNLTLAEAANVQFASAGAPNINWELLDGNNQQVASGTGNVNVAEILAAGDYVLAITSTDDTVQTIDLTLDASDEAEVRPDVSVGPNAGATIGDNVFAPARTTIIAKNAAPRNGFAKIGNDGDLADTMTVFGSRGDGFFKVSYFGPGNITAAVNLGTYTTPTLDSSDAPVLIRQNVVPDKKKIVKKKGTKKVTLKKTLTSTIRATASSNPALADSGLLIYKTQ